MYIADYGNNRIRKVTISTGIITTIAGTGARSYSGDNDAATAATLRCPTDVALDSTGSHLHYMIDKIYLICNSLIRKHFLGNVYIGDTWNSRIRKVTVSTGIITTIAGTGTGSYSGDNGAATSATLSYPYGVGLDTAGNVYIADWGNHRIRKVTVSTGIITTIAGTGASSYSGDNGPATSCLLYTSDAADE